MLFQYTYDFARDTDFTRAEMKRTTGVSGLELNFLEVIYEISYI